jgi:hypothetical protein
VKEGHLVPLWKPPVSPGETKALGLYRADSQTHLDRLLADLPLSGWMHLMSSSPGAVRTGEPSGQPLTATAQDLIDTPLTLDLSDEVKTEIGAD